MKVLLDANVIVAAFAAHGLCEAVFEVCLDAHDLLLSAELLDEVSKNLRKKIKLPDATVASILHLLHENSELHSPHHVPAEACRDPKDLHILGLADSGGADCIVTGDKDLLTLRKFKSCKILTPRQFSDLIHGKRIQSARRGLTESAGKSRCGVEDERASQRRSSAPRWPRVMRRSRRRDG